MSPDEVRVPDIGDFSDVPIIEIHVSPGDEVAEEDPLVTLESDKATMDVPSPYTGTVKQLSVQVGDRVSEGSVLLTLERGSEDGAGPSASEEETARGGSSEDGQTAVGHEPPPQEPESDDYEADVVVIGSGPGGYTAAFRAADLGLKTILVERYESLGGVCLNVGCIPSKALLHAARVVAEAAEMSEHGLRFGDPEIDLEALMAWKDRAVEKLTDGVSGLARRRDVEVVQSEATFTGPHSLRAGERQISFAHCIIATGSEPAWLPFLPDDPRIVDSTTALSPQEIPGRLLVIGGGIIGLEMATVYDALGSRVTVVELLDQLIPGCDQDLVKVLHKRISGRYEAIHLKTEVKSVEPGDDGLSVELDGAEGGVFDQVLVAVGRRPVTRGLDLEAAGVEVDERGFIPVNEQRRTNVESIYAIGDVAGEPLLAHKAAHEGRVAAEAIAGQAGAAFDARAIPAVAYTDPEVAWMGLTESAAREQDIEYESAVFPWSASGRALSVGRDDGLTKLLVDPESRRVLGAGIVGVGAGELIAEAVHALEMGADAEDLGLTIHPHPTLSETVGFAAEVAAGTVTDLPPQRQRQAR